MPAEAFEVGERASREHDGEKRICEIIERKQLPNGQRFESLNSTQRGFLRTFRLRQLGLAKCTLLQPAPVSRRKAMRKTQSRL